MTEFVPKNATPVMPVLFETSKVVSLASRRTTQMFEERTVHAKPRARLGEVKVRTDVAQLAREYVTECENRQREMLVATTVGQLVKAIACVPEPAANILYSPIVKVSRRQCGFVVEECAEKILTEAVKQAKESFSDSVDTLPPARAVVARIAPYAPAAARKASIQLDSWESARSLKPA